MPDSRWSGNGWPDSGWRSWLPRLSAPHSEGVFAVHTALVLSAFFVWLTTIGPVNAAYHEGMLWLNEVSHAAADGTGLVGSTAGGVFAALTGPDWKAIRGLFLVAAIGWLVLEPWLRWALGRVGAAWSNPDLIPE